FRRRKPGRAATAQIDKRLLPRCREKLGLLVGIGGEHVEPQHHVRLLQVFRWLERAAIQLNGLHHLLWREMRSEGVGEAQCSGQLRAKKAGTEYPERNVQAFTRHRVHGLPWLI